MRLRVNYEKIKEEINLKELNGYIYRYFSTK